MQAILTDNTGIAEKLWEYVRSILTIPFTFFHHIVYCILLFILYVAAYMANKVVYIYLLSSLQNTENMVNFATPLKIQMLKRF